MTETLVEESGAESCSGSTCNDSNTSSENAFKMSPVEEVSNSCPSGPPGLTPEDPLEDEAARREDVGTVVVKAKKAAQSLWVLIHAQNCRYGRDSCPHKGCSEAKKVLLHIKTCSAGSNGARCPNNYNGCQQARKLLVHYQKCREIRAKQAGMGRRVETQRHVCLVCSLVARHARNFLEVGSNRKTNVPKKQVIASFSLSEQGSDTRRASAVDMPPPPPRRRDLGNEDSTSYDSRSQPVLFNEAASATSLPVVASGPANTNGFGNSFDTRKGSFLVLAASALQNLKQAPPKRDSMGTGYQSLPRRPRAESYDERVLKQHLASSKDRENDPTLELGKNDGEYLESFGTFEPEGVSVSRRHRSASLGVLASACTNRNAIGFDSISEENG